MFGMVVALLVNTLISFQGEALTMSSTVRVLPQQQTSDFDTEYVDPKLFGQIAGLLDQHLGKPDFEYLDIGGGNGNYADKILTHYPSSRVTIVEPELTLVEKNTPNERKTIVNSIFQDSTVESNRYDAIGFNWVLHHFVGDSYAKSLQFQRDGLASAYEALQPGGLILILENYYDGTLADDMSGRIIYELTAAKSLKKFTAKMGANTAGVGVCFHSQKFWADEVKAAGFEVLTDEHCYDFGALSTLKKRILCIKRQHVGLLVGVKR
jgi:SAM-dependent methyltransferase